MATNYKQSPLPFHGQKRHWNGEIKIALKQFDDCNVFVDLFGGSGLLSRMVKDCRPDAVVLYNDYDDYHQRIANIPRTNAMLADLRGIVKECPDMKLIRDPQRTAVLERIKADEATGYVDYITLSSSLMFSMKYATSLAQMAKTSLYNNVRKIDYTADGYLDGLNIVKQDYRELFASWKQSPNVCFLVDPPYLSTDAETYTGYWKLKDHLDVMYTLEDTNYFYFTSEKSNVIELFDWIERKYATANPFRGAVRKEMRRCMGNNNSYVDIMLYRHTINEQRNCTSSR